MSRCLQLAQKGIGTTRPNPSVGAVLVVGDKIIGEGFTKPYGQSHAEVNAIESVEDKELLKEATMYVTLEPCSHYGKTPPCSDLIIKSGIPKVVVGCLDTNSLVSGRGIKRMEDSGCEVTVGLLELECRKQHRRFFTYHEKKRPHIILKWAETADGFIAPLQRDNRNPVWITNKASRQLVHQWRAEEHAILVGTNTVVEDNPRLNVRSWEGGNPIRVVIDRTLRVPQESYVYDQTIHTIVITEKEQENEINLLFEKIDFSKSTTQQICDVLYKHNIQSVIVEGGTKTLQSFIDEGLWDEARVFVGDVEFEEGIAAPVLTNTIDQQKKLGSDTLKIYYND